VAEKKGAYCNCLCCNHPIVKTLAEFYFLVWGVIGLLFLVGVIWGMLNLKNWQKNMFDQVMSQQQNQMPGRHYR
jgi:hypothetical protein